MADTIISLNDKLILEKPRDAPHAIEILTMLSDAGTHDVLTSVWIAFIEKDSDGLLRIKR